MIELASERTAGQAADGQQPRALVLHRSDEPLDHRDAAVLADGSESLLDAATTTPPAELLLRELNAVVGDEVSWSAPS